MESPVSRLSSEDAVPPLDARKQAIRDLSDRMAGERSQWIERNAFYYEDECNYMRFLIPEGQSVLELGCGNGHLLADLKPSRGVGLDLSPAMIETAQKSYPDLTFEVGDIEDPEVLARQQGPFDVIILSDTIGYLEDCQTTLEHIYALCKPSTRIVIAYYSKLWEPVLKLGMKMPQVEQNWLSSEDISNLLELTGFDVIRREWRQLLPKRWLGLGPLVNRFLGTLPVVRRACLRTYLVARPVKVMEVDTRKNPGGFCAAVIH